MLYRSDMAMVFLARLQSLGAAIKMTHAKTPQDSAGKKRLGTPTTKLVAGFLNTMDQPAPLTLSRKSTAANIPPTRGPFPMMTLSTGDLIRRHRSKIIKVNNPLDRSYQTNNTCDSAQAGTISQKITSKMSKTIRSTRMTKNQL